MVWCFVCFSFLSPVHVCELKLSGRVYFWLCTVNWAETNQEDKKNLKKINKQKTRQSQDLIQSESDMKIQKSFPEVFFLAEPLTLAGCKYVRGNILPTPFMRVRKQMSCSETQHFCQDGYLMFWFGLLLPCFFSLFHACSSVLICASCLVFICNKQLH